MLQDRIRWYRYKDQYPHRYHLPLSCIVRAITGIVRCGRHRQVWTKGRRYIDQHTAQTLGCCGGHIVNRNGIIPGNTGIGPDRGHTAHGDSGLVYGTWAVYLIFIIARSSRHGNGNPRIIRRCRFTIQQSGQLGIEL